MATNQNTIVLKAIGHHDEGVAGAAILPGEAVRLGSNSKYTREPLAPALATGRGLKLAKEDALQGKTTADAYALDDILFFYSPVNGDHVQVLVKTNEDIDVGDILIVEGSGSGMFVEASSSATAAYPLVLSDARISTTMLPLTVTANGSDMGITTGTPGTDAPTLRGVDFGSTTSDEKCGFEVVLPRGYRAGQPVTVRVKAGMLTTVATGTITVDVEAWEADGAGLVGSDLCTTAAQSINSLTLANKDFVITPTTLSAGDKLLVRFSFAGTDTANIGVMVPVISNIELRIGDAVDGQLEALEDSGGVLAAATLIKCRVLNP